MLKLLDRYLLRNFWETFFLIVAASYVVLFIVEFIGNYGDMLENEAHWYQILSYFWYQTPSQLTMVVPLATMLAVLFSLGVMARNKEVLAFVAAGVSPFRIAAPLAISGVMITGTLLTANETFIHQYRYQAKLLQREHLDGKEPVTAYENVFRVGEPGRFFVAGTYNPADDSMTSAAIVTVDTATWRLKEVVYVDKATYEGPTDNPTREEWSGLGGFRRTFDASGSQNGFEFLSDAGSRYATLSIETGMSDLLGETLEPEYMNAPRLLNYIQTFDRMKKPTNKYWTDFWMRLLFPFACLALMLVGVPFALLAQSSRTMLIGFGYGMAAAAFYYAGTFSLALLCERGFLPAWCAGVVPIAIVGIFGLRQIQRSGFSR